MRTSMPTPKLLYAALFVAAVQPAARADDAPKLSPSTSVTVTYRLSGISMLQGATKLQAAWGEKGRSRLDFFRFVEAKVAFASRCRASIRLVSQEPLP